MMLESLQACALSIPFNTAFKHASAERAETQTLWVEARGHDGVVGYGEGCPREYVTGESLESAQAFIAAHRRGWLGSIGNIDALIGWVAQHATEIDANPAAWAAVELALLDLLGKMQGRSVEALIGVPELSGRFRYTAVLGDAAPRQFDAQLARYRQAGFGDFKIKLSGDRERDMDKVASLSGAGIAAQSVRVDANNLWRDADTAIAYLRALDFGFLAIEEPLQAGDVAGMRRISAALDTKIILDESLLRVEQLDQFCDSPERWIVNVRISKMGGLLRSLHLARKAGERGLRVIVGAHVGETSVLTRAALVVAQSARDILLAQEGAYGTHLLAHDVAEPPLMFGAGGILDADVQGLAARPGWGLAMSPAALHLTHPRAL